MRKLLFLSALAAVLAGLAFMWRFEGTSGGPVFKTAPVQKGDILATVSATGTLEPEDIVDVGAQVTGMIVSFGPDVNNSSRVIDYRSEVQQGALLATIDKTLFQSKLEQAQANLKKAEADVAYAKTKVRQAERERRRAQNLSRTEGAISAQELDQILSNFELAQASQVQAEAAVAQAQASLKEAETNLNYTEIRSPVKGVIIDRRVNIGQTVVSGLNAPSLFLIAKDLSRMEIWALVNEADFGSIKEGQMVRFKIATYPGQSFEGHVKQVRYNAKQTSTVVTYPVVISFDNRKYKLAPYLTANLTFEVSEHKNVLKVPNSVLRWRPDRELVKPEGRATYDKFMGQRATETEESAQALLWKREGNLLVPVEVTTGLTDGTQTEIITDQLHDGDEVVCGLVRPTVESSSSGTGSPTIPQLQKKRL
jgi:HlyD family secretion protein